MRRRPGLMWVRDLDSDWIGEEGREATIEDVRVWAEEKGLVLLSRDVLFPDVPVARRAQAMSALLGHVSEGAEALNHNMAPDTPHLEIPEDQ